MGKTIISLPFLGMNFSATCFKHAGNIAEELKLENTAEISNEMNNAKDGPAFKAVMEKYFGEYLKIKL